MEWIKKYGYLILSLLLFVFAFVQEHHLFYHNPEDELVEKFELQLHKQKDLLNEKLDGIETVIADSTFDGNYQASLIDYSELYHNQGLGFVVLEKNELIYWSHNHFAFTSRYSSKMANQELLALPNGTYLGIRRQVDSLNIIGLIHIKDVYGIENQFINNQFVKPFKLPDSFVIQREKSEYNLPVRDEDGNYLFSVMPSGKIKCTKAQLLVPAALFALAFIFLLFLFVVCLRIFDMKIFLLV